MPNRLAGCSSPYLLQHAENPVDWYPWGKEALDRAQTENKPILLSIGYSACHWCHVMEEQCFENEDIASLMNAHFISIKVDREERPDIDNLYMDALHLMGIQGGWPLNIFLTPDQLPFYGGTYFPPDNWTNVLKQIARAHAEKPSELQKIGERNREGLQVDEHRRYPEQPEPEDWEMVVSTGLDALNKKYDRDRGGFGQAPKFPMPCVYRWLFQVAKVRQNPEAMAMALNSLEKIAIGGIHDVLGGGFARYSVDSEWKVPHFEKMLYDNAQLLSLYSIAFVESGKEVFREAALGIIRFCCSALSHPEGGFYSALDADSEGVEGRFYAWTREEIAAELDRDFAWFEAFYDLPSQGNFEHGHSVLRSFEPEENFIRALPVEKQNEAKTALASGRHKLLNARNKRTAPSPDDKVICSWNGLMISGLCEAFKALGEPALLHRAEECAAFLLKSMKLEDGSLLRIRKNRQAHTHALLDDYAHLILALTDLYEITGTADYLWQAEQFTDFVVRHFRDESDGLFFYSPDFAESLVARRKELGDNVIPSANAQMALALNRLGRLLYREDFIQGSEKMLNAVSPMLRGDLRYVSQWMQVLLMQKIPPIDLVIIGKDAAAFCRLAWKHQLPGISIAHASAPAELPPFRGKDTESGQTRCYVCSGTRCLAPVAALDELDEILGTFHSH